MDTGHHGGGVEAAHDEAADAEGQGEQRLDAADDAVFDGHEDGSDDGEGQVAGDKDADQRGDEEVKHGGNDLVQPFFQKAHDPHGDDDRDDVALVAHHVHLVQAEPDALGLMDALGGHGPGVLEVGVDHHHADDGAQVGVAAEGLGGAVGDEDGQEGVGRVGEQVGEHIDDPEVSMLRKLLFTMKFSASMMPMRKPLATMAGMMGTKMSPSVLMARLKGFWRRRPPPSPRPWWRR